MGGGRGGGGGGGYIPEEILLHPDNPRLEGLSQIFLQLRFCKLKMSVNMLHSKFSKNFARFFYSVGDPEPDPDPQGPRVFGPH
jgi:hypothetical protein